MVALARLLPSLRSLLIFESVARSGSCSAAAREFNLTQPSASRNIAQLEAHLGVPLFTRTAIGMELTREGQMLYQALGDGFQRVEAALQELSALRDRKDVVELSLSTAFVTHWLVPRLAQGNVEIGHSPTQSLLAFRAPDGALVLNTSDKEVTAGSQTIPAWGVVLTGSQT